MARPFELVITGRKTEGSPTGTPGVQVAQTSPSAGWEVVDEQPLTGGWNVVDEQPMAPSAATQGWDVVGEEPIQGSTAPFRGGAVEAGGTEQLPPDVPPAVPADDGRIFGRTWDLPRSEGLVMRPDDRTVFDKIRGVLPQPSRIPQRIVEKASEGIETMQQPGILAKGLGALQTAVSPITGTSAALIRDPVLQATGNLDKANQAANLGELLTPGVGLGLGRLGAAGRVLRDAPEAAPTAARAVPSQVEAAPALPSAIERPRVEPEILPPERAPNQLGPVIPEAEEVLPGTNVGRPGGRPDIDRNAAPGEFVEAPNRPLSDAEKEVLASVGRKKRNLSLPSADDAVTAVVDNLHPFRVADRALEKVRKPGEATVHELARLTRGAPGGAQHAIRFGTYDYATGLQNGPGLAEVVRGVNADGLRAYMLARRTLELEQRGIKSGVDVNAAAQVARETGGYYEKVFRDVVDFQDRILQYYRDAGFLSNAGYRAMKALNAEYIPLQKVIDEVSRLGPGKNLKVRQVISKIKGSDEYKNVDPLKSIVDNTYTMLTMAERNRALNSFVDQVERLQGFTPPLIRKAGLGDKTKRLPGEAPRLLPGPTGDVEPLQIGAFIKGRAFHPSDDTITVWRNGRPQYYKVDPKIAAAAKGLGEAELGTLTRLLAAPSRAVRHLATSDPFYMVSNLLVDQVAATAQSKSGYKPFLTWLSGAKSAVTKDQSYRDWLKAGGAQSVRYSSEFSPADPMARRDLEMITRQNPLGRVGTALSRPVRSLTEAKEVVENATKIGEFKRVRKQLAAIRKDIDGSNIADDARRAAYQSRIVTQDFASRGADPRLQQWNAITAFMNGNIQGNARELENVALSGRKQLLNALKVYAAMIALPSIYTWAANHGDPRYDNAPWSEKDRYWLYLPRDPNAPAIKIRKPFLPGTVIGSGIERSLEKMYGENPEAFKGFLGSIREAVTPPWLPNVTTPVMEAWANKSTFTDRDIIPGREKRLSPELQYGPGTSEAAKQVGDKLGVSPRIVDHYIQGYGATVGVQGVRLLDSLLRPKGAPEKPDTTWRDSPFVRRAFSLSGGRQPISDFYDNFAKYDQLVKSADRLRKLGQENEAQVYLDRVGEQLRPYYTMMNGFSKKIRDITDDRTMSGRDKRDAIQAISRDMVDLAKMANKLYHEGQRKVNAR